MHKESLKHWFTDALFQIKKERNLSQEDIAEALGISRATLANFKRGKTRPSYEIVEKISKKYNIPMPIEGDSKDSSGMTIHEATARYKREIENLHKPIKYFASAFSKGEVQDMGELNEEQVSLIFEIPNFNDCDFAFNISGSDMQPLFNVGDIVLVRKIDDKSLVNLGEVYLIVTKEFTALKYVHKSKLTDHFLLKSENPQYDEWDIPIDKISEIYSVKGLLRRKVM